MDVDIDPEIPDKKEIPFKPVDTGDDEGEEIQMTSTSTNDKTPLLHPEDGAKAETSFIRDTTPPINHEDIDEARAEAEAKLEAKSVILLELRL